MSKIEKVSIALPTEMLETVKDAVSSGQYASASEVVQLSHPVSGRGKQS